MARAARGLGGELRGRIDSPPTPAAGRWPSSPPRGRAARVSRRRSSCGRPPRPPPRGTVSTVPAWQPLTGAALGLATAVALGYLLYRGAVRINLTRFFTWTGGVPDRGRGRGARLRHPRPAGGGHPAGPEHLAFDVSGTVDESSWYGALLKGVFNFSPQTTWLQAGRLAALPRARDGPLRPRRPPPRSRPATPAAATSVALAASPPDDPLPGRETYALRPARRRPRRDARARRLHPERHRRRTPPRAAPVSVTSTDDSCDLSADSAPAGTVTFASPTAARRSPSSTSTRADGKRIVGEVENIGPGLQGTLIVTAGQGTYLTSCKPGMSGEGHPGRLHRHRAGRRRGRALARPGARRPGAEQLPHLGPAPVRPLVARTALFVAAYTAG